MGGNNSREEDFDEINEEILNYSQNIYYVWSQLRRMSKNKIYIAFRRLYRRGDPDYFDRKQSYALKVIEIDDEHTEECFEREKNSLDILKELPYFIQYENPFKIKIGRKNYILAPMKYYYQTDLYSYITQKHFTYTEDLICMISYQSLTILKHLKERKIVHNDIKFQNFIIKSEKPFQIILTDFEGSQLLSNDEKSDIFGGTPIFESPEVLREELHDYSSDLWSLGVNIYYVLFGTFPFDINANDSKEIMLKKMKKNELKKLRDFISNEAWELVKSILVFEPDDRISVENALKLDWFDSIDMVDEKVELNTVEVNEIKENITNG